MENDGQGVRTIHGERSGGSWARTRTHTAVTADGVQSGDSDLEAETQALTLEVISILRHCFS